MERDTVSQLKTPKPRIRKIKPQLKISKRQSRLDFKSVTKLAKEAISEERREESEKDDRTKEKYKMDLSF